MYFVRGGIDDQNRRGSRVKDLGINGFRVQENSLDLDDGTFAVSGVRFTSDCGFDYEDVRWLSLSKGGLVFNRPVDPEGLT